MPYPGNPRRGDVTAIAESLSENAQYKPLVVQHGTHYILVGNHTWAAAKQLGWDEIDVVQVVVDEQQARKILLSDNKTSDLGTYDKDELSAILAALDGDLTGTAWTPGEADELIGALLRSEAPMPDFADPHSEPLVLEAVPSTNASYAETPQQEAARAERQAAQTPRPYSGLTELMLLYTEQEKGEVAMLLSTLRSFYGPDMKTSHVVLWALRGIVYVATEKSPQLPELLKRAGLND